MGNCSSIGEDDSTVVDSPENVGAKFELDHRLQSTVRPSSRPPSIETEEEEEDEECLQMHTTNDDTEIEAQRLPYDPTQRLPVDIILYLAQFIVKDSHVLAFGRSSQSNMAALRNYHFKGQLNLHRMLKHYYKSMHESQSLACLRPDYSIGRWSRVSFIINHSSPLLSLTNDNTNADDGISLEWNKVRSYCMKHKLVTKPISIMCGGGCTHPALMKVVLWLLKDLHICELRLSLNHQTFWFNDFESRLQYWHEIEVFHLSGWEIQLRPSIQPLLSSSLEPSSESSSPSLLSAHFPRSLTSLQLPPFDRSLKEIVLPSQVTIIQFSEYWNRPIEEWPQLPSTLETLILSRDFNHSLDGCIFPFSLTRLELGAYFDQSLKGCRLPHGLKHLALGGYWNRPISELPSLPSSLETLHFSNDFNHSLDELQLPSSLRTIIFGTYFNQSIAKLQLPNSLTKLDLGNHFHQPIPSTFFPPYLEYLQLSHCLNQSMTDWQWPTSLTHLQFGRKFSLPPISTLGPNFWPEHLTHLTFYHYPIVWKKVSQFQHLNALPASASMPTHPFLVGVNSRGEYPFFHPTKCCLRFTSRTEIVEWMKLYQLAELNTTHLQTFQIAPV